MASEVKTNKISPATSATVTLGDASDVFQLPASAEIDIASGATLDVNGNIDVTGATLTGFPGLFSSYAIIADQKSQNTDGGTFTSGAWRTRDLQTELYDGIGLTISSDEFTLPAGNYLISWAAMAGRCAKHQSRLYDVTGTAQVGVGSSCVEPSDASYVWQVESSGAARVTPSGSNAYRIEHQCQTTRADVGFGTPANFTTEQYTLVTILKES